MLKQPGFSEEENNRENISASFPDVGVTVACVQCDAMQRWFPALFFLGSS